MIAIGNLFYHSSPSKCGFGEFLRPSWNGDGRDKHSLTSIEVFCSALKSLDSTPGIQVVAGLEALVDECWECPG